MILMIKLEDGRLFEAVERIDDFDLRAPMAQQVVCDDIAREIDRIREFEPGPIE